MAPVQFTFLLACLLAGFSSTVSIGENWPSEASSPLSHQSSSSESDRTFIASSRKGQHLSFQRLLPAEFKERDLDHLDHQELQLHASEIHHSPQGLFHDHETDYSSHGFSHAVLLLEVSFGEADALLAFKDGIGNYSEGALDDWTPGKRSEYCSWTGVTCNRQLHVTALNLSSLDLTGSLGPSLCNLSYLEELHLDQNYLHSEIPPELGRLSRLRILNLEENRLYGSIPKVLGNLTSLQVLNLGSQGSWFNGTIPEELGQLSELRSLNFGAVQNWDTERFFYLTATNQLRGTIPRSLGNCTKLWYLDFYGNDHLTGLIPEELGKLIQLKYLSFQQNNFTGSVPNQLENLTTCEYLSFGNNSLQGHLPVGLANLSRLILLDVGYNYFSGNLVHVSSTSWTELLWLFAEYNSFTGTFPELLLSCRNLEWLELSYNNFSGNLPGDLGRLSSARSIRIKENMFGGEIPESLTNISLLTDLTLFNNKFTGPLDALRNSTLLEYLDLASWGLVQNKFTGRLTDAMVRSWPNMKYLYLYNNALMGKLTRALGNVTQLIDLYLMGNKLEGGIPEEFGDLQKLEELSLYDNELTGKILASLAKMQDVLYISLGNNTLTGSIPQQLGNLTKIRGLSLHTNNLTGEIPPDLGLMAYKLPTESKLKEVNWRQYKDSIILSDNYEVISLRKAENTLPYEYVLDAMALLDISGNQLTGELPMELGTLQRLTTLFMADNNFVGSIPAELGEIPNLLELDLSGNQLSGPIPVSLSRLRLGYLNLSLNQLCGPIPVADSFDTRFFGSFLPGNPKLCGDSIDKPCESFAFSCDDHLDTGLVTERTESWSLYFHGEFVTAFAVGAFVGFATIIGLVTLIPALRKRFLF